MKFIFWRIAAYFGYLSRAKTRHGIHSPFVYRLLDEVVYNSNPFYCFKPLEAYRLKLINDETSLKIEDHGAGSSVSKGSIRKVGEIARNSLKSRKYAQLIFRLAAHRKDHEILEFGTSLGLTTLYLSYASPDSTITTVEGDPSIARIAEQNFKKFKRKNIHLTNQTFEHFLEDLEVKQKRLDLVFLDGHHEKAATLRYFQRLVKLCDEDSLVIVDDIHWSPGMNAAWKEIKKHEKVSLALDFFELGLVYFMPRKQKEEFVIRF